MSTDEKLRELEDAWKRSGALADEVRYLNERVRRGEVPYADLIAAALLGYPAARAVASEFHKLHGARPAEAVTLTGGDEIKLDWPISFGGGARPTEVEQRPDVRNVIIVQRAIDAAQPQTRVRVSRAYVVGPDGRRRRFVLSIEVSPEDENLPGEPPRLFTAGLCTDLGFPHIWRFALRDNEDWRFCRACGHGEVVPYTPPAPTPQVGDAAPTNILDAVPVNTIDYETGRFSISPFIPGSAPTAGATPTLFPPDIMGTFNYVYEARDDSGHVVAEDEVAGDVLFLQGRTDYSPIKRGTFRGVIQHGATRYVIRDDSEGHLHWQTPDWRDFAP